MAKGAERRLESGTDGNDRLEGVCHFIENALHEFTVEAWEDHFKSWQVEYSKKYGSGNTNLRTESDASQIPFQPIAPFLLGPSPLPPRVNVLFERIARRVEELHELIQCSASEDAALELSTRKTEMQARPVFEAVADELAKDAEFFSFGTNP